MARAFLALLLAVCAMIVPARAADVRMGYDNKDRPDVSAYSIWLTGEITFADASLLDMLAYRAKGEKRRLFAVYLDSPGGSLMGGIRLGQMIRKHKLTTILEPGTMCASACILAFAGGTFRMMHDGARIGVHGASEGGLETTEAMAGTLRMARLAADLGVPDSIITKIVTTPPDQMHWLGRDDLKGLLGPVRSVACPRYEGDVCGTN